MTDDRAATLKLPLSGRAAWEMLKNESIIDGKVVVTTTVRPSLFCFGETRCCEWWFVCCLSKLIHRTRLHIWKPGTRPRRSENQALQWRKKKDLSCLCSETWGKVWCQTNESESLPLGSFRDFHDLFFVMWLQSCNMVHLSGFHAADLFSSMVERQRQSNNEQRWGWWFVSAQNFYLNFLLLRGKKDSTLWKIPFINVVYQ